MMKRNEFISMKQTAWYLYKKLGYSIAQNKIIEYVRAGISQV